MEIILKRVAKRKNKTIEEIKVEIENAITIAMSNPDPVVQDKWKGIKSNNGIPTVDDFLLFIHQQIT